MQDETERRSECSTRYLTDSDSDRSGEASVSTQCLPGSVSQDVTTLLIGLLLVAGGLVAGNVIVPQTRLTLMIVDGLALLVVVVGIRNIVVGIRHIRIRSRRGGPEPILKEGINAEREGKYEDAWRFYSQVIERYPSTTAAEDAKTAIDLLKREGKVVV